MIDEKYREILNGMNRRDFIVKSLAAGAITLMPRVAGAAAAEPFRIGVLLDTTGAGANYCERSIKGLPLSGGDFWGGIQSSCISETRVPSRTWGRERHGPFS